MNDEIAGLYRQLTLGLYVIGLAGEGGQGRDAFAVASVMPVSDEPALLAVSVDPRHPIYALMRIARTFSISVLQKDRSTLARRFGAWSGRELEQLPKWRGGRSGVPVIGDAIGWFECETAAVMPAGDHCILLGRIVNGEILDRQARPATRRDGGDKHGGDRRPPARA